MMMLTVTVDNDVRPLPMLIVVVEVIVIDNNNDDDDDGDYCILHCPSCW